MLNKIVDQEVEDLIEMLREHLSEQEIFQEDRYGQDHQRV